ncbi:MAG TPA: bifunctional uroporphyrinogen-III C-methyltransferase/uroporphyrinogen-III synthase [Candidatus Angelobacter sp.]|nr:bifunctional uroporphyrinogen-III C-methyltransferase/uroporphyrinogen-III synthase [Candidatus Angelobacter sp.]
MSAVTTRARKKPFGSVAFVAAGPGDPDLVTLRAAALLREAGVIVADVDVVPLARTFASAAADVVPAVDENGLPLSHAARAKIVGDAARAGHDVVRLFSGDPLLDGALQTEAAALARTKIHFDIAPGVSTLTGIPAYAGIALLGGKAREVRLVDADDPAVDWTQHADPRVTLVVVNGADRALDIARALLDAGRAPGTPIAITRGGTTVEQRTIASTLGELPTAVKAAKQAGPGMVVVGETVATRDKLSWFETKPLFGWRVLVPRTREQAGALSDQLVRFGAVGVEVPTISVEPPRTPQQMERAITGLVSGRFQWVVFTSVNAVRAVREKFDEYGLDARAFAGLKVAAVGEQTAGALTAFGVRPDLVPTGEQSSAGLLEDFPEFDPVFDPINRVFLPRADIATDTLVAGLVELGWEVEDVTAYRTVRAAPPAAETREAIKTGGFDAVLFTSSSTVRNLVGIAGKPHASTVIACIGPATAKTAEEHGLRVDVLAETPSVAALAEALAAHGDALRLAAAEAGESVWRPSKRRGAARRKAT